MKFGIQFKIIDHSSERNTDLEYMIVEGDTKKEVIEDFLGLVNNNVSIETIEELSY